MIIHKEEHFAICQKVPGISSQSTEDTKKDMIDLISDELKVSKESVHPIHRLDNPVGGVMIYGLSKIGAREFGKLVSEGKLKKTYLAVIKGSPNEKDGVFKDLLFKDSRKNKSFVVSRMRKGVKEASLEYKVLDTATHNSNTYSLVEILLHTGRTHQIRVQFASRKLPLTGDRRYGSGNDSMPLGLWSYKLEFENPFTSKSEIYELMPNKNEYPWKIFYN